MHLRQGNNWILNFEWGRERERKRASCLPLMQQKSVITFKRVCQVLGMNIWRWLWRFFVWGKTVSLSPSSAWMTLYVCLIFVIDFTDRQTAIDSHSLVEKCDRSIRVWNYASMKFFREEKMFLSVSYIDPPFSCQGSVSFSWVIHGHQKAWSEKREKDRKRRRRRRRANGGHSSPSSSLSLSNVSSKQENAGKTVRYVHPVLLLHLLVCHIKRLPDRESIFFILVFFI